MSPKHGSLVAVNPKVFRWILRTRKRKIEDIAYLSGLSVETLKRVARGEEVVVSVIIKIADETKMALAVFFLPEPPKAVRRKKLFRVKDNKTGKIYDERSDLTDLGREFKLVWSDMETISVGMDGCLYLLDECGGCAYLDGKRFKKIK